MLFVVLLVVCDALRTASPKPGLYSVSAKNIQLKSDIPDRATLIDKLKVKKNRAFRLQVDTIVFGTYTVLQLSVTTCLVFRVTK